MRFLIDANISPKIAEILRILDVDAIALIEEYPADISDIDLFQRLAGSDWIFVTADRMIKRRTAEAKAFKECGISAVFIKRFWHDRSPREQTVWIGRHWEKIEEFASSRRAPFYIEVDSQGKITQFTI